MQSVETLSYDVNSSLRFNNFKRFETELNWIKLLQTASPLGFNNIYHEGNISKMPNFDVFSISVNPDLIVKGKKEMTNEKDVLQKI